MSPLLWLSRSICLLFVLFSWQVVLACKVAILAYVILLMVFSFFAICVLEISFHGVLPSSYLQVISSCFHRVHHFQVVFRVWVVSKLVAFACVAFRLFSQSVWPSSWTFLSCITFTLVSWCLSYFAFHLVLSRVWLTRCFHGLCYLQVVVLASAAVKSADFWH